MVGFERLLAGRRAGAGAAAGAGTGREAGEWEVQQLPAEVVLPPEDGDTFAANAGKKASEVARRLKSWVIADDSGLCVDALGGAPGVYSARFAGENASDHDNLHKLLAELHGVHAEFRQARYHCVIVFVRTANDPDPVIAHGKWEGQIILEPRGSGGFGYDPVFQPAGLHSTAAQLTPEEKNKISHRAQALLALVAELREKGIAGT